MHKLDKLCYKNTWNVIFFVFPSLGQYYCFMGVHWNSNNNKQTFFNLEVHGKKCSGSTESFCFAIFEQNEQLIYYQISASFLV